MLAHRALATLLLVTPAIGCSGGDGGGEPCPGGKCDNPTDAPFGLDSRPSNPTCTAPERPPSGSSVTFQRAFPQLTFTQPVFMLQAPGDDSRWYVVEKRGVIFSFDNVADPSSADVFLDHRSAVNSQPNEGGLLGVAFHPDFAQNGVVFLSYTIDNQGQLFSVVTRMRSTDGGQTLDASTEELILFVQQPFENHNGGGIAFGPDGFLYIGYGDGGSANDPSGNGQNTQTRLGKLLRIDVDGAMPFESPPDNPFIGGGGLPEIYAWGLRNPWRFSFDMATGDLWLADVGQDEWEEIDIIERGGNYGWNLKEAFECFTASSPCDNLGVIDPVFAYDHSNNDRSITGGYVYRGSAIPSLVGSYVYGDFVSGRVWALFPDPSTGDLAPQLLFESGLLLSSFAQGADGEVYLIDIGGGTIQKLMPQGQVVDNFPQRLSETGCFDPSDPTLPTAGLIPYTVNAPLWSDGAVKTRWMAIPDGQQIHIEDGGDWTFPAGTVLAKHFVVNGELVETRLMIRHDDGAWAGYAYEWLDDHSDALLLQGSKTVDANGMPWRIPSRADCMACHTAAAGRSLGPETGQLNGDGVYPSTNRNSNQIATLVHIDMFDNPPSASPDDLDRLPNVSSSAPVDERARAYLHTNCSQCHRPGGPGRSDADMRWFIPFANMNVCNEVGGSDLGVSGARLLVPGDPTRSLISLRMRSTDVSRMPALGSVIIDDDGVTAIDAWIESISACP